MSNISHGNVKLNFSMARFAIKHWKYKWLLAFLVVWEENLLITNKQVQHLTHHLPLCWRIISPKSIWVFGKGFSRNEYPTVCGVGCGLAAAGNIGWARQWLQCPMWGSTEMHVQDWQFHVPVFHQLTSLFQILRFRVPFQRLNRFHSSCPSFRIAGLNGSSARIPSYSFSL